MLDLGMDKRSGGPYLRDDSVAPDADGDGLNTVFSLDSVAPSSDRRFPLSIAHP